VLEVRPRTDQTHFPAQNIEKLRQLIEVAPLQNATDSGQVLGPPLESLEAHRW